MLGSSENISPTCGFHCTKQYRHFARLGAESVAGREVMSILQAFTDCLLCTEGLVLEGDGGGVARFEHEQEVVSALQKSVGGTRWI